MATMIPSDLLERIGTEADAQDAEIQRLRQFSSEEANRRPDPKTWSVLEHIEHLNMTNRAYLGAMAHCIKEARAAGMTGAPPWKMRWIGSRFLKSLAPPVRRRLPTFGSITPSTDLDAEAVFRGFAHTQQEIRRLAEEARGLDLGAVTLRSPLLPLMRLQLGVAFLILQTHNQRHFWNIRTQRASSL